MTDYRLLGSDMALKEATERFGYVTVAEGRNVFYYAVNVNRSDISHLGSKEIEAVPVNTARPGDIRRLLKHQKESLVA